MQQSRIEAVSRRFGQQRALCRDARRRRNLAWRGARAQFRHDGGEAVFGRAASRWRASRVNNNAASRGRLFRRHQRLFKIP